MLSLVLHVLIVICASHLAFLMGKVGGNRSVDVPERLIEIDNIAALQNRSRRDVDKVDQLAVFMIYRRISNTVFRFPLYGGHGSQSFCSVQIEGTCDGIKIDCDALARFKHNVEGGCMGKACRFRIVTHTEINPMQA